MSPTKSEDANRCFIHQLNDPYYIKNSKSRTVVENRLLDINFVKLILKSQLFSNFMILNSDCAK